MTKLTLHDCLDAAENFLPALPCFAACNEVGRQFFPLLGKRVEVEFDVCGKFSSRHFVGFCEDNAKRDAVLTQPLDELQIDALWLVARIDKQKEVHHLRASQDVAANHLLKLFPLPHASACITIAGKVHKIPIPVDKKMVDENRLAGCGRGFCQMGFTRQHIDEARFAYVASPYEGKFGQLSLRTLVHSGTANGVFGGFDNHEASFLLAPILWETEFLI